MQASSKLSFELLNKINADIVKNSKYIIYAHACPKGVYVGIATDPVERWQQHLNNAFNESSQYCNEKFKDAILAFGNNFNHYIVAVSDFEKSAKNKEAAAIAFYSKQLNMRREINSGGRNYNFQPIGSHITQKIMLGKRDRRVSVSRSGCERKTVIAVICFESGRKRLRTISGQVFPQGLYIQCPKDERERFDVGDKVRVNVAMSENSKKGRNYLIAASTTRLVLANGV